MNALAPVAPKLAPPIRLIGTDRDGEAQAVVRAIGRVLAAAGRDWHDLADAIAAPPANAPRPAAGAAGGATHPEMLRALRCCAGLRPKERAFVDDLAALLLRDGRLRLSPKQAAWLAALYDREKWGAAA